MTNPCLGDTNAGMEHIERDVEREPRRQDRHGGSLFDPVSTDPEQRPIRAGQFWAVVREHQWPAMPRWFSYVVYDDAARTTTDEHSGMIAVVWPGGSSYAAAACAAGNEAARLHCERQRSMLAWVGAL